MILFRQKRVDVARKSISCQQKKVDVAQESILYRQKQDDAASKKYFGRKKVTIFSGTARHDVDLNMIDQKYICHCSSLAINGCF